MLLKLGILATILLVGGFIFSSEIQAIFPNTSSTVVNSLEEDVSSITSKSLDSAEQKIESSVKKVEGKISEIKQNSTDYLDEKVSENFSISKIND